MNESAAYTVLFIKTIEKADPYGEILPQSHRRRASSDAGFPENINTPETKGQGLSREEETFLFRRAELLLRQLERNHPAAMVAYEAIHWPGWISALLLVGSFILGFAVNELGAARRISIISFPLFGLLVWNSVVYAALITSYLRSLYSKAYIPRVPAPLMRLVLLLDRSRLWAVKTDDVSPSPTPLATGIRQFGTRWLELTLPLITARVRGLLHWCAALLVTGILGGMYLRGIAFEYVAGWESTFLDAENVHALLRVILGPASAVTGILIPDATHLSAIRWIDGQTGENAAPWIHLYAATAGLFIVLPRLILALLDEYKLASLRRNFPLPHELSAYCRELLAGRHMHDKTGTVEILPFGLELSDKSKQNLERYLRELLGIPITCRFQPRVDYGNEEDHILQIETRGATGVDYQVVVFNTASTPERESHGYFLDKIKKLVEKGTAPRHLIVLLDESSYRRQTSERINERRNTWQDFAQGYDIKIMPLDLEQIVFNTPELERLLDKTRSQLGLPTRERL